MRKYGLLVDGNLLLSSTQLEGYKPVEYAEIPEFDQTTHYVVEGEIIDEGEFIQVNREVKELDLQNDVPIEDEQPNDEGVQFMPKPTTEERLDSLENTLLALMME